MLHKRRILVIADKRKCFILNQQVGDNIFVLILIVNIILKKILVKEKVLIFQKARKSKQVLKLSDGYLYYWVLQILLTYFLEINMSST